MGTKPIYLSPPRIVVEGEPSKCQGFWNRNKGWIFVVLAQFCGALMNGIARLLEDRESVGESMHPLQIIFFRMSITAILSSLYIWYAAVPEPLGAEEIRGLLTLRGIGGFVGVFAIYYSLVYLPISDVTVITFLIPPVTLWAGAIFLGERFSLREMIAVAASFIGIVVVARPLALLETVEFMCGDLHDQHHPGQLSKPLERFWAMSIGMVGVFGGACAYTVIRHIGQRVHPLVSVNYYAVISAVVSLVALFSIPSVPFQMPQGAREWLLLLSMGVSGFGLALGLTAGLQQEKSNAATLMIYTEIIFSLLLDFMIWGHVPDVYSIVGGLIVLASSVFAALPSMRDSEFTASDEEGLTVWSSERLLDEDMLISSTSSFFTFEDPPMSDEDTLIEEQKPSMLALKSPTSAVRLLFDENEK